MAEGSPADELAATRQFVVVLRLVVGAGGKVSGEVVGPDGRSHRFVGLHGLPAAVRNWLSEALGSPVAADEPPPGSTE
jgi:hypothetical protein